MTTRRRGRARGVRRMLFSNSLLFAMGLIFVLSWFAQSLAGHVVMNADNFLQNGQSEFLAVGTMIAFSIFLRQRGSSESKPVGTPHGESSTEAE